MKIEVDISPDEVRRLFGLPDTTQIQQMFNEQVSAWVSQHQNDGDMAQKWLEGVMQGGRQSFEAYQEFLKNFSGMGR